MNQSRLMAFTEHDRVATHPLALGVIGEVIHHRVEGSGQLYVVAVDERENVAGGSLKALVDRVYLAAILFTFPIGEFVFVAANDRNAFVGAAAVDDDVLERLITLIQDGEDRLFQEPALVE